MAIHSLGQGLNIQDGLFVMSFVNTNNGDEQDNSPVCVVLRRYFASQRERENEIERQRGAASQLQEADAT